MATPITKPQEEAINSNQNSFNAATGKYGLSSKAVEELKEIFSLVDRDGGGTITCNELRMLMKTLGLKTTEVELQMIVQEIDSNNDGEIDFDDFAKAMSRKVSITVSKDKLLWAFRKFEVYSQAQAGKMKQNGPKGTLKVKYLLEALTSFGENRMSKEEAEDILEQIAPSLSEEDDFDYTRYIEIMFSNQLT